ncbi:hypothetical protein [Paraburkholderia sp. RL18-085-BIA-A]|uniref:hypothetical protein n=1 Tax=Paraburkholderia sp. RL18-085-BIA-A TaxID=3031633 RepID=UPI0038BABD72
MGMKGGEKLKAKLEEIARMAGKADKVNVGFLENSTYPDGTSVPMVAAIQEYGAPNASIPARPFFRGMIAARKGEWGPQLGKIIKAADYDSDVALGRMGENIKGQLQESIIATSDPALSPITVMLRGMRSHDQALVVTGKTVGEAAQRVANDEDNYGASTKPLIDSGHLLNSVDYEVKKDGQS